MSHRRQAYNCDSLDNVCEMFGVTMMGPAKSKPQEPQMQDDRVATTLQVAMESAASFAWIQNYR